MADKKSRRLAAILFADIQGYTSMMQSDEKDAMARLKRFQEVIQSEVNQFDGEIIKSYGDGTLCLFSSVLEALRCAQTIQVNLQQEPKVPLRIGLHLGDVMYESNDIFGNALNIASRIESLGVAGSVLMSKNIYDKVKNQADTEFEKLGRFQFKNVEESIEVYALANQGLVVPTSDQMSGKLKVKSVFSNGFARIIPILLTILVLGAISAWVASERGWFEAGDGVGISQEFKDKRVAVMLFENQTLSPDLDVFGKMISDWVTKGLMETGEANVISAANLRPEVAQAGILGGGGDFYNATGVGVVIQGRYYLQEDQLIIHANVVDAEKGEVIHALDPIQGPRSKMMDLLKEFTEEILGYWSVRKKTRYLQNPPKYKAYQNLMEVEGIFHQQKNYEKVEGLLTDAFHLDTTFFAPLLKLLVLYGNPGGSSEKADSLIEFIDRLNPTFTKWERCRYEAIKATRSDNWLKAASLNEQLSELDPSYVSAYYNAAVNYVRANYPQRAIEQLYKIDQRFRNFDQEYSLVELRIAQAYFMLGNYEKVVEVAENYPFPKMIVTIAEMHLRALIRMDSTSTIKELIDQYNKKGIYNFRGVSREVDDLLWSVCFEAFILDKNDLLIPYVAELKEYTVANLDSNQYNVNMGLVAYLVGNYEEALSFWMLENRNEDSPWPYLYHAFRMGTVNAKLGYLEKAEIELTKISNFENSNVTKEFKLYQEARVLAALERKSEAILALKKTTEIGWNFHPRNNMNYDIFLKPLFDDPEFQELVKPKG